jgi:hypothetical protein
MAKSGAIEPTSGVGGAGAAVGCWALARAAGASKAAATRNPPTDRREVSGIGEIRVRIGWIM